MQLYKEKNHKGHVGARTVGKANETVELTLILKGLTKIMGIQDLRNYFICLTCTRLQTDKIDHFSIRK